MRKVNRRNLGDILARRIKLHASKGCQNGEVCPKPCHATRLLPEDTLYNLQPTHEFNSHCTLTASFDNEMLQYLRVISGITNDLIDKIFTEIVYILCNKSVARMFTTILGRDSSLTWGLPTSGLLCRPFSIAVLM